MFTNIFKRKTPGKNIVFIVEDNDVYARSLQGYLQTRFPNIKEIKIFRIGELCLLELHRNPNIVIMDYFLNSKYKDANNGLEIIKRIKTQKPQTKIIVLSAQENFDIAIEAINLYDCSYVQKDLEAYNKIEILIKEIVNREKIQVLNN